MSKYFGDILAAATIRIPFNTNDASGVPITLAGTPAVAVYKNGGTTESTAGVSLTVDHDSVTGRHEAVIDTSADGTFYAAGSDYTVQLAAGTVDGTSVVGAVIGSFSIQNRTSLSAAGVRAAVGLAAADLDSQLNSLPTALEAAILDEGDATALLAAIAAKVEEFLINDGDATATLQAIATAIRTELATELARIDATISSRSTYAGGAVASVTGSVGGNVVGSIGSLATQAKADVNAELVDVLTVDTQAEPASVPAANASFRDKVGWLFMIGRNKREQTSTTETLYANDDSTPVATSGKSDDGTTMTRGKYS